jgi:stage V sporulation protein B
MYVGAGFMAVHFFGNARTILPLQLLSLAFPFMAAGTCIRGYFIGLQETKIPAANQVLEQIVRMVVIYFIAAAFVPRGLEYAAAAALIAIVAEEVFSFFFIAVAYRLHKKKKRSLLGTVIDKLPVLTAKQSLGLIFGMALPLTGNRVAGSLLTAWENVLIPRRLQMYGLPAAEAISEFGRIQGMAIPLIFFPTAVLTALSVTLVPAVSEAVVSKDMKGVSSISSKALLFASVTGMGAAALFFFFSHELGLAIYNQQIGLMLQLLGIMAPFIYMQIVLSGILNGLGCQMFIFRNSLLSSGISIAFIFFAVPYFGLTAYVFGWLVSLFVVIALGLWKIRQFMPVEIEFSRWFLRPIIAAAVAGLLTRLLADRFFFEFAGLRAGLVVSVAVLAIVYLAGVLLSGSISKNEITRLFKPKM